MADIVVISCCVAIIVVAFKKYKKRHQGVTMTSSSNIMSQEFDTTDNENELEEESETDREQMQTYDVGDEREADDTDDEQNVRSPMALPSEGDTDTELTAMFQDCVRDRVQKDKNSSNLLELTPMLQVICDSEDGGVSDTQKNKNRNAKATKRDRRRNNKSIAKSKPKLSANRHSSQHRNTLSMMSDLINGKSVDAESVNATAGSPSSRRKRMESVNISMIDRVSSDDMDSDLEHHDDDDDEEEDTICLEDEDGDENDLDMAVEREDEEEHTFEYDEKATLKLTPTLNDSESARSTFMKRLRERATHKRAPASDVTVTYNPAETGSFGSLRSMIPSVDIDVATSIDVIHEEKT